MKSSPRSRCVIGLLFVAAASCGSPADAPQDASVFDAGAEVNDAAADRDSGRPPDGGAPRDGGRDDAGRDAGDLDAARPDANPSPDASLDAMAPLDGSVADATIPDSSAHDAAVVIDAGGPPRPVGAAVDVTGSRCALDEAGGFWCWGRGTPVEDVRLLGTGFDAAWGLCALRGREVWCAGYGGVSDTMLQMYEAVPEPLLLDSLAEYSDYTRGCGVRRLADLSWEILCWTNGAITEREAPSASTITAIAAVTVFGIPPRKVALTSNVEAYDENRGYAFITLDGRAVVLGREREMYPGTHRIIGFALACAYDGEVRCMDMRSPFGEWSISVPGFRDHVVAWPIGPVDPEEPYLAYGLCVGSGSGVRCYNGAGTPAYTVNW